MDKWLRTLRGSCLLEVAGVAMEQTLNRLTKARIPFWGVAPVDPFSWRVWILTADLPSVTQAVERSQCTCQVVTRTGGLWMLRGFLKRKILLFFLILSLFAAYFSSEYVIFVKVEGNETVSTTLILEELESLGFGLGTKTATIQPHDLKFKMLTKIPQLGWLTVTTHGCVATVTVREKSIGTQPVDRRIPTNIVAKEAALVTEMSVLSGISACAVGDVVTKGQLLISGYGDLETTVISMAALGEVYGRTWRELTVVTPAILEQKQEYLGVETNYSIIFGRKRINFSKNSGKVGVICDKMVDIKPLTLLGTYTLPIYWVTETVTHWETAPVEQSPLVATATLTHWAEYQIQQSLVAGQMEQETMFVTKQNGTYQLDGIYQCHEMIGTAVPALLFEDG